MIFLMAWLAVQDKVEFVSVKNAGSVALAGNAKFNTLEAASGHTFMIVRIKVDRALAAGAADGSKFEYKPKDFALLDEKGELIRNESWIAWMESMTATSFTTSYNKCKYVEDASAVYDEAFGEGAVGFVALTEGSITLAAEGLDAERKTFDFLAAFLVKEDQKADAIKFRDQPAVKLKK